MIIRGSLLPLLCLVLSGCVTIPPEVVQLHERESTIAKELHRTHLALIDGYVDQRLAKFEDFYFATYSPKFVANWKAAFKAGENRDYDEAKDFALLHQDLIAEYQDKTAPVEKMRTDLKLAVIEAFAQFTQSHGAVHAWLLSAKKLSDTEKALTNKLLGAVDPKLSLEAIDGKITEIQNLLSN